MANQDGPTSTPTGKHSPAPRDQTASLSTGGHAGVRALVRGLPVELATARRNDGRACASTMPPLTVVVLTLLASAIHARSVQFSPVTTNLASLENLHIMVTMLTLDLAGLWYLHLTSATIRKPDLATAGGFGRL